jgi:hypothetical protein
MRIIGEITHPACKITLYHWNNRYIIKLERDYLEQTFKVDQFDVASETELKKIIDDSFITDAVKRFDSMEQSLGKALQGL